ncbi:Hypothetical_protein [Hexamita inflata]|uniref:Hypothetical_protein n=1 Tax=Hexamita inflata TaxID=28002 RepID=A0ABP1HDX4_9EUKA
MSIIYGQIIQCIMRKLKLEYSISLENQIIMKVLALPDQLLTKFFVQLSFELNIEYRQLYHDFITNIPTNTQHKYKFKLQAHRTPSQQYILFNKQFAQALKTVMSSYFCECSIHFNDDVHM